MKVIQIKKKSILKLSTIFVFIITLGMVSTSFGMQHYYKLDFVTGLVTADVLNVRSGPGTNYGVKTTYRNGTRFDTYEIKNNWARTPSGWVCLDYCKLLKKY